MNPEKLTLEHLAPYLPYGLPIAEDDGVMEHRPDWIKSYSMSACSPVPNHTSHIGIHWVISGETFHKRKLMPLLRPLSSLTKDITHNGETFVPIDHFQYGDDDAPSITFKNAYRDLQIISLHNVQHDVQFLPAGVVQILISWHFDVFGLIDAGLALPIND